MRQCLRFQVALLRWLRPLWLSSRNQYLMNVLKPMHLGRAALTVVLILASQLAFAGQVCRAVMVEGAPRCSVTHASGRSVAVMGADTHAFPCVDDYQAPVTSCLPAIASKDATVTASGAVPQFDLAPPLRDYPMVAIAGASSAPIPFPTRSVGPPLRIYIFFGRFLS